MDTAIKLNNLIVSQSPQVTANVSTQSIMRDVLIALTPVVLASFYFFGYLVLINIVVCVAACVGFELLYGCLKTKKWDKESIKNSSIWDLTAVITGVLLALNLPTTVQKQLSDGSFSGVFGMAGFINGKVVFDFDMVVLCIVASFIAIVITKMLFGGLGKNFANPAIVARIFLLLSIGAALGAVGASPLFGLADKTGATWLTDLSGGGSANTNQGIIGNMFFGYTNSAAVGETSALAILIGGVYLCVRKVIDWKVPVVLIVSAFVFAFLFDSVNEVGSASAARIFNKTLAHILSGGLLFGAVFMATDYSTSPNTTVGKMVFVVGIALFTMLIRMFAAYPEGMSFGILIMNIFTPLIDRYIVPKPFGYVKPVKVKADKAKTSTT